MISKQVGPGKVFRAIDLVDFEPEYKRVMEWIFGDVLVCADINIASAVANHNTVQKKCVTFDGDVVNPSGLISGGIYCDPTV